MELKYSNFSSKKRNENIETGNGNSILQNRNKKGNIFYGSGNENGTAFSGGKDAEMEFPLPTNA
jgi:hypothetical protein